MYPDISRLDPIKLKDVLLSSLRRWLILLVQRHMILKSVLAACSLCTAYPSNCLHKDHHYKQYRSSLVSGFLLSPGHSGNTWRYMRATLLFTSLAINLQYQSTHTHKRAHTHTRAHAQFVQINIINLDVKTIPYNPQHMFYRACRTGGGIAERWRGTDVKLLVLIFAWSDAMMRLVLPSASLQCVMCIRVYHLKVYILATSCLLGFGLNVDLCRKANLLLVKGLV